MGPNRFGRPMLVHTPLAGQPRGRPAFDGAPYSSLKPYSGTLPLAP